MKFKPLRKLWPSAWNRSTSFSADVGPGFDNWGQIISGALSAFKGGVRTTKLTKPYSQHPYASGAIRLAGFMLGGVPFRIVQEDTAAKTRTREALESGDIKQLRAMQEWETLTRRHRPMPCRMHQSTPTKPAPDNNAWTRLFEEGTQGVASSELISATVQQMLGSEDGRCYWLLRAGVDEVMDEKTFPREVSVWPSFAVKKEKDGRYTFSTESGKSKYPKHQVIELRVYSPDTGGAGSPLKAAWKNMQNDLAAQDWNGEFFDNGCQVGNVLTSDQKLTPDQAEAMGKRWEENHRGRGKVAVLGQGVTLSATAATHLETDFIGQFGLNRDAILACLLVHKAALGVTEQLNRATIDAARQMMWSNLLIPLGSYIESTLYAQLFSRFNNGREWGIFDISGVSELADDVGVRAEALAVLTASGIPMNDAVRVTGLDLPQYAWGEDPMGHLAGLETTPANQPAPRALEPKPDNSRAEVLTARHAETRAQADAWWHSVGEPIERKFQKIVRRMMLDARAEVLKNLESGRSEYRVVDTLEIEKLLFDVNRFTKALQEDTKDLYQRTMDSALEGITAELVNLGYSQAAIEFNLTDAAVNRWLETKDVRLRGVVENVRNEIRKAIAAQVKQLATNKEIAAEIRRVSNYQLSPARTLMIARTETGSASNNVRWLGMEAAGVGHISWVAASDAREEHKAINDLTFQAAADGTPYERGTDFAPLVGAPGVLRFPHDPQGEAGMVINCRCVMVPEIPASEDLLKQ